MIEINQSYQVKKGDIIEFDYRIFSLWENSQIQAILEKINNDGKMLVLDYELSSSNFYSDLLKIKVEILQNPFPVLLLVVAIAAIGTSLFIYLSLDKIYLISEKAPETVTAGINLLSLALLFGGGLFAFKLFK